MRSRSVKAGVFALGVWALSVVAVFQHDFSAAVMENPTFTELITSFKQYQIEHSLPLQDGAAQDPSFCKRRFAVGLYSCPHMVGNRMHEFLNTYAAAFVTNRTILWEYCTRKPCQLDNVGDCDEVLERMPWIANMAQAHKLWTDYKCEGVFEANDIFDPRFHFMSDEVAMCCGLDEITLPVIKYGVHDGHDFFGLSASNARLSASSKHRAKLLFQHGEHFAFGALFRTVFRYKAQVEESNTKQLLASGLNLPPTGASSTSAAQDTAAVTSTSTSTSTSAGDPRPLVIGLHLRHPGGQDQNLDTSSIQCVEKMLADLANTGPCYLLVTADRNLSINTFLSHSSLPCKVATSSHDRFHPDWTEHGPFTFTALHDIEIVSRADVFIGSGYTLPLLHNLVSTFSLLIAERIASSGGKYSTAVAPLFLQGCAPVLAGRFAAKAMYEAGAVCPKLLPIEMPEVCNNTAMV